MLPLSTPEGSLAHESSILRACGSSCSALRSSWELCSLQPGLVLLNCSNSAADGIHDSSSLRVILSGDCPQPGHFAPRFSTLQWGLCVPAACSAAEVEAGLRRLLHGYSLPGVEVTAVVKPDMCYVTQQGASLPLLTLVSLGFFGGILLLAVVSTVVDTNSNFPEAQELRTRSRAVLAFSLRRSWQALTCRGVDELPVIHGVRTVFTLLLFAAHKLMPLALTPYSNRALLTQYSNSVLSSVLRASSVFTDAFLQLSGVLTAYNLSKELSRHGHIAWRGRIIARFIRLTPALFAVVLFYAHVLEHLGAGPQWASSVTANAELCKTSLWRNILYIQNFYLFEEMCAPHTHQLSLDMQWFVLAPLVVTGLHYWPRPCLAGLGLLQLLVAALRYATHYHHHLSDFIYHSVSVTDLYRTANLSYSQTIYRATPYIIGLLTGFFLQRHGKIHLSYRQVVGGWMFCSLLTTLSVFYPASLARADAVYDVRDAALYAAVYPITWALALAWLIVACSQGYGGWLNRLLCQHWMVVLSRLSYAIYLTQFIVFFYYVGSLRSSQEFSLLYAIGVFELLGVLLISLLVTLLFDLPMQEIKNILLSSRNMEKKHVVLETKLGKIKGQAMESVFSGKTYYAFRGVPYGKPPIGNLRFKDPEPFGPWEGIRDALHDGNSCVQKKPDYIVKEETETGEGDGKVMLGDEDCLFLNVYTNKLPTSSSDGAKVPVMFFIHGGAFIGGNGSSKLCGPDFLMEENVVLVSVNYRCGPFGFLSLENDEVPGNAGLKDQSLALRWVRDHIISFGGDPENVTIFGISAGGASVHYHLMSPLSKGLFHKAIIQSGCAFNIWALQREPLRNSLKLAQELGCTSNDPSVVLRSLRGASPEDLILAQDRLGQDPNFLLGLVFAPCVETRGEQPFLHDHPDRLMAAGEFQKVPTILGITQNEGSVVVMAERMSEKKLELHNENPTRYAGRIITFMEGSDEEKAFRKEIAEFYTKGEPVSWDNVGEYIKFLGDIIVNVGMAELRSALVATNSPVYSYLFANHRRCPCTLYKALFPEEDLYKRLLTTEACHASEALFLFTLAISEKVKTTNITEQDKIEITHIIKAWTNFASTGDPNGNNTKELWEKDSSSNPCFMEIAERWAMRKRIPLENRINFWKHLAAKDSIP